MTHLHPHPTFEYSTPVLLALESRITISYTIAALTLDAEFACLLLGFVEDSCSFTGGQDLQVHAARLRCSRIIIAPLRQLYFLHQALQCTKTIFQLGISWQASATVLKSLN